MDIISQLKLCTMVGGAVLVGSETFAYYLKNKSRNLKSKLANGHLISKEDIIDILGTDGLILSKDIQLKEKFDYEGSITFGATGAGKSTGFFLPNLLSPYIKGSIVVPDPKGELFQLSSGYQRKVCGRKVLKFSPLEPEASEQFNLLTSCKDNMEVLELAESLIFNGSLSTELATGKKAGGIEWVQMATPYLSSALLYCRDLEYPYNTIEFAFQLLITLNMKQLNTLFSNSDNQDCLTQWRIFKSGEQADRTVGSIKITFATNMKIFADERVNRVTSKSTFNIETFRKEPTILYIVYPANKANYLAAYTAPFFSKMLNSLVDCYTEDSLPIHIFADEFANLGMINSMNNLCSTIRSSKISMNICLQGLTQLFQIYGRDNGKTILNNLKTKMVFPSMSDEDALNYISNLCGEQEIEIISRNENKNSTSVSYSKTKRKMFSQSDLRCLDNEQLLILTSNKQPILSQQDTYYKNEKYTKNIESPVPIKKGYMIKQNLKDELQRLLVNAAIRNEDEYDVKTELFRD